MVGRLAVSWGVRWQAAMPTQLCPFCRLRPGTSRDHLFSRRLVPPPKNEPLLVWACPECNSEASVFEEDVRNAISRHLQNTHHSTDLELAAGLRALRRYPGKARRVPFARLGTRPRIKPI